MTTLDLLNTIGRAKSESRMLVTKPFAAVDASQGGTVLLPIGTRIEVSLASGGSISAVAEIDGKLRRIYIFVEQYHCVDAE